MLHEEMLHKARERRDIVSQTLLTRRALPYVAALSLWLFYLLRVQVLRDWLIDDAGISLAYSRNFFSGFGLVSQAGKAPVEGFSNPLWTLLLGAHLPFSGDPTPAVKVLSAVCVGGCFWLMASALSNVASPGSATFGTATALVLLATNTSFCVWTASGLENPLNALLVALFVKEMVRWSALSQLTPRAGVRGGGLVLLLALTRPEGFLFVIAIPPLILSRVAFKQLDQVSARRIALSSAGTFAGGLLTVTLLRRLYFNDWVPNTFHAKAGSSRLLGHPLEQLVLDQIQAVTELAHSLIPAHSLGILAPATLGLVGLYTDARARWQFIASCCVLLPATCCHSLLPSDWMTHQRFSTPFLVVASFSLGLLARNAWVLLADAPSHLVRYGHALLRPLPLVLAAFGLVYTGVLANSRQGESLQQFASAPRVPFSKVIRKFGYQYNSFARELGLLGKTFLVPDVGGALYASQLDVHDLAGLCDVTLARLIHDPPKFRDYVFNELKPEFLHTHGYWSRRTGLTSDPRLARDYRLLSGEDSWPNNSTAALDLVRRDAVLGK